MIWAYYRVSSDLQDYKSQRVGIVNYCRAYRLCIDKEIIDKGISGTIPANKRKLKYIMRNAKEGDTVLVSELSRLGRCAVDVLNTCKIFVNHKVKVYCIKQNLTIDHSPMGKMMVTVLAAFAEMERDLISQRTKEGLARLKQLGMTLGRPVGSKNTVYKLTGKEEEIKQYLLEGKTKTEICKILGIHRSSIYHYFKRSGINPKEYCKKEKLEETI